MNNVDIISLVDLHATLTKPRNKVVQNPNMVALKLAIVAVEGFNALAVRDRTQGGQIKSIDNHIISGVVADRNHETMGTFSNHTGVEFRTPIDDVSGGRRRITAAGDDSTICI